MTSQHYAMSQMGATQMNAHQLGQTPQQRRMMRSAKFTNKRSVSETKKICSCRTKLVLCIVKIAEMV